MIMKSFRSSFYTVNSNSSFEAICRKPKRNVALNRKNDSTLNNPLKGSVDSVITNAKTGLRKMKIQFPEKLIISRSKSDSPSFMIENNVDILLNSETKLDDSFHQVNIKYVDLVCLIDVIEIQSVVSFYYTLEMTFQPNF